MANVTNHEPDPPNTEPLLSVFLFVGLITVVSAPFDYWKPDNDIYPPPVSEHLTKVLKSSGCLRINQTGTGYRELTLLGIRRIGRMMSLLTFMEAGYGI